MKRAMCWRDRRPVACPFCTSRYLQAALTRRAASDRVSHRSRGTRSLGNDRDNLVVKILAAMVVDRCSKILKLATGCCIG
jgi:hypothetical protein